MNSETLMTFASLVAALLAGIALFYGNFLLAYAVDLVTGQGVPPGRFLRTLLVTAGSAAATAWLVRLRRAVMGSDAA